jgi:hypothetical protein
MPTLSKPELIERQSPWDEASEQFYQELCLNRVPILVSLGYYEERNLPVPELGHEEMLSRDEETEIKSITGALTQAADASEILPRAVLIATLNQVSKEPCLFRHGQLPESVEWAIARTDQRADEKPGTRWQDVWSGKLAFPEGKAEAPTELNIAKAKAAVTAIGCIESTKSRGRPPNVANQILADELGEIFRRSGQRIVRRRVPIDRYDEAVFVEGGPFYDFVGLVLPPLQAYLSRRRLPPVTIDTIVRLATEGFLRTR